MQIPEDTLKRWEFEHDIRLLPEETKLAREMMNGTSLDLTHLACQH